MAALGYNPLSQWPAVIPFLELQRNREASCTQISSMQPAPACCPEPGAPQAPQQPEAEQQCGLEVLEKRCSAASHAVHPMLIASGAQGALTNTRWVLTGQRCSHCGAVCNHHQEPGCFGMDCLGRTLHTWLQGQHCFGSRLLDFICTIHLCNSQVNNVV